MDLSALRAQVRSLIARSGCSRAELVALAVLVAGAVVLLGLAWMRTPPDELVSAGTGAQESLEDEHGGGAVNAPFAAAGSELVIHVAGAVASPGLYELTAGARVADALEAAGGAREDAVLDDLNLARVVTDGERLLVADEAAVAARAAGGARRADGSIDLNRATEAELEELPGVGPVLAGLE